MNTLKTLRTHWKKTVFAVCVSAYGANYLKGKYEEWNLMKEYCLEAKKHGEKAIGTFVQPRKVTVILNPAANKGGGRDAYKKKVAPLLHLAGFEVELILTKHEGHGKQIMSELGQTSAVVIAAGDGTISEVVTGIMKRPDEQTFSQTPICVVPLGKTNTLAHLLHPTPAINNTQFIGEMVMALVDAAALKYVDVFSVQAGEDKKVYGVGRMSVGAFTDSLIKRNSWYHRLMDGRVGYYFTSLFGWQDLAEAKVTFSKSCEGCNQCRQHSHPKASKPWWSFMLSSSQKEAPQIDYSSVVNVECNKIQHTNTSLSQIDLIANVQTNSLVGRFYENKLSHQEFTKLGLERSSKKNNSSKNNDRNENNTDNKVQQHSVSFLNLELSNLQEEERKLQIDSETYDLMKILTINLLPNKLKFYFNPKHYVRNT